MRLLTFTILGLFLSCSSLLAQNNYFFVEQQGTSYELFPGEDNVKTLLGANENDQLSSWQSLPFEFEFYGDTISGYHASDNGYITFNDSANESITNPVALSEAGAPKNSIFGFWRDFSMGSIGNIDTEVYSFTLNNDDGPDVHIIQWSPVIIEQQGNNGFAVFAIRLYENNQFDVVINQTYFVKDVTGAIGAKSPDGSKNKEVGNSPNFNLPNSLASDGSDDQVYVFREGPQPNYDVEIFDVDRSSQYIRSNMVLSDENEEVNGEIYNYGKNEIGNLAIKYVLNNSDTNTAQINTTIGSENSSNFSFTPSEFTAGNQYDIKWWVSKIDGNNDEFPGNNTPLTRSYFINNGNTNAKSPLIEEFSTANCGWCPDGKVILEDLKLNYSEVIVAQHHAAFGTDAMTISEHQTYANDLGIPGAPTAMIDRVKFKGQESVGISRTIWSEKTEERLNFPNPAELTVDYTKDSAKNITVNMDAKFVDQVPSGDLRITAYLVQNTVKGSGEGYDQVNYLNSNPRFQNHQYFGSGDPIEGYEHEDVVRDVLTPAWGNSEAIPDDPQKDQTYTTSISYNFEEQNIPYLSSDQGLKIVAFVSYYNSESNDRIVVNAAQQKLTKVEVGKEEQVNNNASAFKKIYPNPANALTSVNFSLEKKSDVSLEIYSPLGKHIKTVVEGRSYVAGDQKIAVNVNDMKPGIYIAKLSVNDQVMAQQFMVK